MKSRLCLIAVFISILFTTSTLQAETRLKLAHVASEGHSIGKSAIRFADALAELSDGELVVDIHPRGEMGGVGDIWVQMQTESLDMQTIDIGAVALIKEARHMMVLTTPFLFRDQQHYRNVISSSLFAEQADKVTKFANIRLIAQVGDRSPRIISTTNRKVVSVDDMKGLKMRVPGSPVFIDTFKFWQSVPTPTKASEILLSLKSGLVDGQDNGIIDIGYRGNTPIKHVTPINWMRSGIGLFIGEARWRKLSDKQKNWISEASIVASSAGVVEYESLMEESWLRLKKLNVRITEPDMSGFTPAGEFIVNKYEGELWPKGLVSQIRAIE